MNYNVSDFIDDSMTGYSMWASDCQEGNDPIDSTILDVTKSSMLEGVEGKRTTSLSIKIQPDTVQSSVLYSDNNAIRGIDESLIGQINFCARFSLQTASIPALEVNFLETLVTMTIDFTGDWTIQEITTETNLRVTTTTNNVYSVDSYDCSGGLLPPIGGELEGQEEVVKNQGAEIRICVEPNADALRDGIYIREVQSFAFTRGNVTQDSVINGAAANNGLSRLVCTRGTPLCYFETVLKAAFYTTQGIVDGTGVIVLQYGTAASRRLGGTSRRDLQRGDDAAGVAEVEVEIEVNEDHLVGTAGDFWLGGIVAPGDIPAGAKSGMAILGFLSICATALLCMQLPRFKSSRYYV
jgi:hypothetical protein